MAWALRRPGRAKNAIKTLSLPFDRQGLSQRKCVGRMNAQVM